MHSENFSPYNLHGFGIALEHFHIIMGGKPRRHALHIAFLAYGADFIEDGGQRLLAHLFSFLKTNITYY